MNDNLIRPRLVVTESTPSSLYRVQSTFTIVQPQATCLSCIGSPLNTPAHLHRLDAQRPRHNHHTLNPDSPHHRRLRALQHGGLCSFVLKALRVLSPPCLTNLQYYSSTSISLIRRLPLRLHVWSARTNRSSTVGLLADQDPSWTLARIFLSIFSPCFVDHGGFKSICLVHICDWDLPGGNIAPASMFAADAFRQGLGSVDRARDAKSMRARESSHESEDHSPRIAHTLTACCRCRQVRNRPIHM